MQHLLLARQLQWMTVPCQMVKTMNTKMTRELLHISAVVRLHVQMKQNIIAPVFNIGFVYV